MGRPVRVATVVAAVALAVALTMGLTLSAPVAASAWENENGPQLEVPAAVLARSLACTGNLATGPTPVLLIPGTGQTPDEFSWNYVRAFTATHRPFCTVELPNHAMSDIQVSAEYVVSAIRTMQQRAHRTISVVGHSQGGMIFRWALKFWPDTRRDVDDVIGLAPSNHGTVTLDALCLASANNCAPALHQQRPGAQFYRALNSGPETFPEPSYTQAYTDFDEVVVPNMTPPPGVPPDAVPPPSSRLSGGSNVANLSLQQLCPGRLADHITIGTSDAVAYAIVIDALDHPGPARGDRIDRAVCAQPFQPGVNPATFPSDYATVGTTTMLQVATYPRVPAEPPLKPYARSAAGS